MLNAYKSNWLETKSIFKKWWKCEDTCRPLLFIKSPKDKDFCLEDTDDMNEKWTNIDSVLKRQELVFSNTSYIAETIPYTWPKLGPGSLGAFLGAVPKFANDTIWLEPCFDDIEKVEIFLDESSKWWNWSLEYTKEAVSRSKDKFLVGIPDLVENLDTIASLIGTEKTLFGMIDSPGEIHRLQKQILPLWFKTYDTYYDLIKDDEEWSIFAGFNIWGKGKTAKLQCDYSIMISKDMFYEFVYPYLKEQCDYLDNVIYHLDGPDAVRHLDAILSIESIKCLQWSPGDGNPDGGDICWDDIYRKALNSGKNIYTYMEPKFIKDFVQRYGTRGVYIMTSTESEKEAGELLKSL